MFPNGSKLSKILSFAFFLFWGVFCFYSFTPRASAAFGVSPPFFNADHLVPGVTYQQTIYLVQDQTSDDLTVNASLEVPDTIKNWFTVDKGYNFVIPKGTRQFPVVVSVHIPSDITVGKYNGNLVFQTIPGSAGQVTIALGANVSINLTIGNDIFEKFSVPLVTFPDIEEGWNPRALVKFQNDGNIPESFDSATFDLYDQFDAVRLAYITKQAGFPTTPPFTMQEYTIEFPTDFHLGVGDYWGVVNFYQNQKLIASQKTVFHVLKTGTLTGTFGIVMRAVRDNAFAAGGGAILIIGIVSYFWFARKRKRTRA